jgi:hypothetical protein
MTTVKSPVPFMVAERIVNVGIPVVTEGFESATGLRVPEFETWAERGYPGAFAGPDFQRLHRELLGRYASADLERVGVFPSEDEARNWLQRSQEYKERMVTRLFHTHLGRSPDKADLLVYTRYLLPDGTPDWQRIEQAIFASPEWQGRARAAGLIR